MNMSQPVCTRLRIYMHILEYIYVSQTVSRSLRMYVYAVCFILDVGVSNTIQASQDGPVWPKHVEFT
jgi:hypothetical protein